MSNLINPATDGISNELEVIELNNRINKLTGLKNSIHWYSYPMDSKLYYASNSTDCVLADVMRRKYKWSDYVSDVKKHWREWLSTQISSNNQKAIITDDYEESSCATLKNCVYGFLIFMLLLCVPLCIVSMVGSSVFGIIFLSALIILMLSLSILTFCKLDEVCEYLIFPNMINKKELKKAIVKSMNEKYALKSTSEFNESRYAERFKKASIRDRNKYMEVLSILDNSKNNVVSSIIDRDIRNLYNRAILSVYLLLNYEKNYPEVMDIIENLCTTYITKFNEVFDINFNYKENVIFTYLKESITQFTKIVDDYIAHYSEKCNKITEEKLIEIKKLLDIN